MRKQYGLARKFNSVGRMCALFIFCITLERGCSALPFHVTGSRRLPVWTRLSVPEDNIESSAQDPEHGLLRTPDADATWKSDGIQTPSSDYLTERRTPETDVAAAAAAGGAALTPRPAIRDLIRRRWIGSGVRRVARKRRFRLRPNRAGRAVPGPFLSEKTRLKFLNALRRFEETKDEPKTFEMKPRLRASYGPDVFDEDAGGDKSTALSIGLDLRALTEMLETHRKKQSTLQDVHRKLIDIG